MVSQSFDSPRDSDCSGKTFFRWVIMRSSKAFFPRGPKTASCSLRMVSMDLHVPQTKEDLQWDEGRSQCWERRRDHGEKGRITREQGGAPFFGDLWDLVGSGERAWDLRLRLGIVLRGRRIGWFLRGGRWEGRGGGREDRNSGSRLVGRRGV